MAAPAQRYEDDSDGETQLDAKTEEYLQDSWMELFELRARVDAAVEKTLHTHVEELVQPDVLRELCIDIMSVADRCARVVSKLHKAYNRLEKIDEVHDCI